MNSNRIIPRLTSLILLLLSLSFSSLWAQTGTIKGLVTDSNYQPLPDINVSLEGTHYGAATEADGHYQINNVPAGSYTLVASGVGFQTQKEQVTIEAGQTYTINFTLSPANEQLREVLVEGEQTNKFADKKTDYVARMPLENLENPQVYSVISNELMEEQVVTDIQGAVQNAPGINNVGLAVGSGGVGLDVNMRGFNTGIAMRNGMATNFVTLSDPVNLERIEVIKGPSATLFGSSLTSYGGLLNRVTKQPFDEFKGEVGYSGGSFGLSRITADINTPLNSDKTVLFRVNAAKHNENSFQDHGQQRNWAITPNLLYKVNDRLTVNIEAELFHTKRPSTYFGISPGVTADSFEGLSYDFDHSYSSDQLQSQADVLNVYARATYQLSDNWKSETYFSSGNTDNKANYLFLTFLDNSRVRRMPMYITSNFNTSQIQQNFTGHFDIGTLENKLLVGLDFTHLTTSDRRTRFVYDTLGAENPAKDFNFEEYKATLAATPPFFKYQRTNTTYSAYISDVISITEAFDIMAGVRVDHFSNTDENFEQTAFSPKFGAVYQVLADKLSLFANFMDGFDNVAPDNSDPDNIITFEPEHATQLEGGIKTNLFSEKLAITLSYYDITVRNILREVPNDNIGGFNQVQDGTRSSKGFEAELITNPINGWNIVAGYGYNDSEYTKANDDVQGNRPYATPEHTLNFWTSYNVPEGALEGLGLGFGGNYVSESYLNDANTFKVPAYTVLNATIFYDRPQYRIGVKINNIGDEEYWTSSYWAHPHKTRNFVVNLKYKF